MNQNNKLIDELKIALKTKNITYKAIGLHLKLSEGTIKRIFSNYDFTLHRLEDICSLVDLELFDLLERMKEKELSTEILPVEYENELVSDIQLLLTAHLLINKWTVQQILSNYEIDKLDMIQLLSKLDAMRIIDYLPGERVRLKISRNFKWINKGPIQQFFNKNIESEFFNCNFTSPGEIRLFISGMLTKSSNTEMQRRIKKLAVSFDDLHKENEQEILPNKFGTSLVLAMRPWDINLFDKLKKPETKKVFK
ncbi:MAG: transcriptional regulator [Gammaproteobacteria bacterium]|nr:MAG: transcriptional regulator [Gammaproteobacteria bacterium]PHR81234.1 MAG: transcriptional regulator [Colwellia sp.]